jgi:hypothetical protein
LRVNVALPGLPPGLELGADPEPAGAPGAAEPPVCAFALAAPHNVTAATSPAVPHLIPADARTRKPTSFSGLRG